MKKTLTLSGLLVIIGIIVFFSCKKNDSIIPSSKGESSFTNVKYPMNTRLARRFYNKLTTEEGDEVTRIHANVPADAQPNRKHPLWSKAIEGTTDSSTYVEIPLLYNKRPSDLIIKNNATLDDHSSKVILNNAFDRLLISKNKKTGKVSTFIVTFIPDEGYAAQRKDNSLNRIGQLDKAFSGYMKWRKWDGTPLYLDRVVSGALKNRMTPYTGSRQPAAAKTARTAGQVCTTYCDYEYAQNCYSSESGGYTQTWCDGWVIVGTYCWEECVDDGTGDGGDNGGGGGGGSGGDSWSSDVILNMPDPGKKIDDMNDYLKCFSTNGNAAVSIYVDQPTANSTATWSGSMFDPNVGHTFIAIEQNNITRVFGFYPANGVSPASPSTTGALVDDSGHEYDVKITIGVTAAQLAAVLNTAKNAASATYNLNSYNCTDFGLAIAQAAGITLPDTQGTWPLGGGSNPGNLGQDIRSWSAPSNVAKNTNPGNGTSNTGSCP
jgi:hypothetical protein